MSADLSPFNRDLKGADKSVQSFGQRIKGALSPKNLAIGGAVAGVGFLVAGFGEAVQSLMRIERIGAQTDAAIRSTGGAANVTRQEIDELAGSIEKMSGIEAESITEAQNLLLTFKSIRNEAGEGNDIFNQATRAMVDLGVAMGTDTKSGAIQLGKALNDPVMGLAALRRVGIQFTREQEDMIRVLVEAGDVMGAQKIMLAELESQFGGSAEALGETTAGQIAKFQHAVGDMFESIILGALKVGEIVGGALDAVGGFFENFAMDSGEMGDTVHRLADETGTDFQTMKDRIKAEMAETGDSFEDVTDRILSDAARGRIGSVEEWSEAARGWHGAIEEGGELVKEATKRIASMPANMMSAELDNIRDAAFQQQVAYAKGLLDGRDQPLVQMEALRQLQSEEWNKAAEEARLLGHLNSTELANGMASANPYVRAQAVATRQVIINQLANLGVDASNWGYGIAASLASGLNRGYGLVVKESGELGAAVRGQIGIDSEPKDPTSPLRGITKWGGNLVKTYVDGMLASLGLGSAAAGALAASLVPGFGTAGIGVGSIGAGSPAMGAAGHTININAPTTPMTERDIGRQLRRTGVFGVTL